MTIREMTIDDYEAVIELFKITPGIALRDADSRAMIERYLTRNPGLSLVAEENGRLIGCVMCGYDGRRGGLHHLVVRSEYRGQGLGERLVKMCLNALHEIGIYKTHLFVFKTNLIGNAFWMHKGWNLRDDVNMQ